MHDKGLEDSGDLNDRMLAILLEYLPAKEPLEVFSSRLLEEVIGDAIDECLLLIMPPNVGAQGAEFETKVPNYRGKAANLNKVSEKVAPWKDRFDRAAQQRVLVMSVDDPDHSPIASTLYRTLLKRYDARHLVLLTIRASTHIAIDDTHQSALASFHYLLALRCDESPLTDADVTTLHRVSDFLSLYRHMREQRERLDDVRMMRLSILNAVNDMVFILLPQTDTDPRLAYVSLINRSFADYFGIVSPSQKVKKDYLSLRSMIETMSKLPKFFHPQLIDAWNLSPRSDRVATGDLTITLDEQTRHLVWHSGPIWKDDGTVRGRIVTVRDVTGEVFLENARQESISRTLHELNTPMTTIKGYSDLLISMSNDMPKVHRYALLIQEAALTLRSTFDNMVHVMRARAGTMKLYKTKANLNDLLIGVVASLEQSLRERGQTIALDIDDDIPLVIVDAIAIRRVITNLLTNAIKYSPPDTQVSVETKNVQTRIALPDHAPDGVVVPAAVCIVKDQGGGVGPDDVKNVFASMWRAPSVTSIEGSGFGLTIAKETIVAHDGKLWALANDRVTGGYFAFTLPLPSQTDPPSG